MSEQLRLKSLVVAGGVVVGLYAVGSLYRYIRLHAMRATILSEMQASVIPTRDQIKKMKSDFIAQLETGLKRDVEVNGQHCLMLPTYITQLPDGMETGDVYAIDVGGTNFRVMRVRLSKEKSKVDEEDSCIFSIPKEVYTGPGHKLFDFFATNIKDFIDKQGPCSGAGAGVGAGVLPTLGFCFSFPMKQTAVNQGVLVDWTKGFTCTGVVGEDPVRLLSEALQRVGCPCDVKVVLNDTVGVLAAQRYVDPATRMGVIIGTGTNACYVEKMEKLTKWSPPDAGHKSNVGMETVVNIEWGAFSSDALPRCPEDVWVDAATVHAGKYVFEKLISGMFMGDVVRHMLIRLQQQTHLFSTFSWWGGFGQPPAALFEEGCFSTADLCAIAQDRSRFLEHTGQVLVKALGVGKLPLSTRRLVQKLCLLVAERSALLLACALDGLLTHTGWTAAPEKATIAFDGGVYEKFGLYRDMLLSSLIRMMGDDVSSFINLTLVKDGSCMGAAVLAAAAARPKP